MNDDECHLTIFEPKKAPRKINIKEVEELNGDRIPIYEEDGTVITDYKILYNELEETNPKNQDIVQFIENWEAQGNAVSELQAKKIAKRKRLRELRKRRKERNKRRKVMSSVAQCNIESDPLIEEERAILQAMKVRQPSVRKIFNIKPSTCIPLDTNFNPSANSTIRLRRKKFIDTVVLDDSEESDSSDNIRLNIDNAGSSTSSFTKDGPYRTYKSFIATDDLLRKKKKKIDIVQISDSSDSDVECVPLEDVVESISDDDDDNSAKKNVRFTETNSMDVDENVSSQLAGLVDNFVEKYIHTVLPSLPKNLLPLEPETYLENTNETRKRVTFNEIVTECDDESTHEETEDQTMDIDKPKLSTIQNEDQPLLNDLSVEKCDQSVRCEPNETDTILVEETDADTTDNEEDSDDSDNDFYDMVPSPNYDPVEKSDDLLERLSDPDVAELSSYICSQLNENSIRSKNTQHLQTKNTNFQNRNMPSNRFQRGRPKRPFGNSQNYRTPQKAYQKPADSLSERFSQLYEQLHNIKPKNSANSASQSKSTEPNKPDHACQKSTVSDSSFLPSRSKNSFEKRAFQSLPSSDYAQADDNLAEDTHRESSIFIHSEPGPRHRRPFLQQRLQQQQNYDRPVGLARPVQGPEKHSYQSEPLQNEQIREDDFEAEPPKNFQTENYNRTVPTQRFPPRGGFQKRAYESDYQNEPFETEDFEEEPKNSAAKNHTKSFSVMSRFPARGGLQKRPSHSDCIPYERCDFEEETHKNFGPQNRTRSFPPLQRVRGRGGFYKRAYQMSLPQNEQFEGDFEDDTPQSRRQNKRFCRQNPQNFNEPFKEEKINPQNLHCENNQLRGPLETYEEVYENDTFDPSNQKNYFHRRRFMFESTGEPIQSGNWRGRRPRFPNQQKRYSQNENNQDEPYEEEKYHPPSARPKPFPQNENYDEPYEEEKYHPPSIQPKPFPQNKNYDEPYEEEKYHPPSNQRGRFVPQRQRLFQNNPAPNKHVRFRQEEPYEEEKYHPPSNQPQRFSKQSQNYAQNDTACDETPVLVPKSISQSLNVHGEPYEEEKFHPGRRGGNFNQNNRFPRNNYQRNCFPVPRCHDGGNFSQQNLRFPNHRQNFQNRYPPPRFDNQNQHRWNRQRFAAPQNSVTVSEQNLYTFRCKANPVNLNQIKQSSEVPTNCQKESASKNPDDLQRYESTVMKKFTAESSAPSNDIFTWENKTSFDFVPIPVNDPVEPPWAATDASPKIKAISRRSWINDNVMNQN